MLKVACVYKSGAEYTPEDVRKLTEAVAANLAIPHETVCITDDEQGVMPYVDHTVSILHDLPYWWPKLQMFNLSGPVLYFDLDTVILHSIDHLCNCVRTLQDNLMVLADFYHPELIASGIMGWAGSMQLIWDKFEQQVTGPGRFHEKRNGVSFQVGNELYRGDQDWLRVWLPRLGIKTVMAQSMDPGICSFKVHCRNRGIPAGTNIVCFHGRPKPAEVGL